MNGQWLKKQALWKAKTCEKSTCRAQERARGQEGQMMNKTQKTRKISGKKHSRNKKTQTKKLGPENPASTSPKIE
jgi:hypothetical protein